MPIQSLIYLSKSKRKRLSVFLLGVIMCLSISTAAYIVNKNMFPAALVLAKAKAERIGTLTLNETVLKVLKEEKVNYKDLVYIAKNENGEIVSLQSNTVKMNELKSKLAVRIQNEISNVDTVSLGIPIGSLSHYYLIMGRGPKIPVKMLAAGNVVMDFTDSFFHAGINQTKHEVALDVKLNVSVVLPAGAETVQIKAKVPVAETIIVGKVPNVFFENNPK